LPSIINASSSGSGGIVQTADASGVLQLQSNGTTALTVDTSANVGIGATPTEKLTVNGNIKLGTSGTAFIYGPSTTGRSIISNSDSTAYMVLYGSSYGSSVDSFLQFTAGTTSTTVLNANGALSLAGAVRTATGVGITFPATQSASSDANTLDDYEEGTWTPVFKCTSVNPTYTATSAIGKYTKIGNVVYYSFYLYSSGGATGGSGDVYIGNLPFNALADGRHPRGLPTYLYWGSADKWAASGRNGLGWAAVSGPDLILYAANQVYANGIFEMGGTGFYYV
jgi:hypothetical protein